MVKDLACLIEIIACRCAGPILMPIIAEENYDCPIPDYYLNVTIKNGSDFFHLMYFRFVKIERCYLRS